MNKKNLAFLKKLIAWKNSQVAALMGEECIRDLIAMDATRADELLAAESQVANRKSYIAKVETQISEVKASLAAAA